VSVKDFGICDNTWEILAKNRSAWRAGIKGELTVQRPHDWMKRRRNVLPEKPVSEALLLSAPNTHVRRMGKTVMLGSDSSATSALNAHSALQTE